MREIPADVPSLLHRDLREEEPPHPMEFQHESVASYDYGIHDPLRSVRADHLGNGQDRDLHGHAIDLLPPQIGEPRVVACGPSCFDYGLSQGEDGHGEPDAAAQGSVGKSG